MNDSWIIHGDADTVVYLRQSEAFVDLIRKEQPTTNLRFDVAHGQDHAFDVDPTMWEPYADAAMKFVVESWL
jgi:dienelactone hydrolase